jgi:gliding motility-associated-like protein
MNGSEFPADTWLTLQSAGWYDLTLTGTLPNGCSAQFDLDAHFHVYQVPLASFDVISDELSVLNTYVTFENTTALEAQFSWDFGGLGSSNDVSPSFEFPSIADLGYRVCLEASTDQGCTDVTCREIYIPGELIVYVPTAFTPDGDGINEVFKPIVSGFREGSFSFRVFNRWGEELFYTTDPAAHWMGEVRGGGHYAQNDTYVWVLEVQDAYSADKRRFTGHVTLIR